MASTMFTIVASLTLAWHASAKRVLILGGSGRIGSACAAHLLHRDPTLHLILCGRDVGRGSSAVTTLKRDFPASKVDFEQTDWMNKDLLRALISSVAPSAIVHTAGPYNLAGPVVLEEAIHKATPVYVDLSDPLSYIDEALLMTDRASSSGTTALLCAGAFPGLSNLLAMECAARLPTTSAVRDLRFSYFTAGLGGSGEINLLITNEGFGEPVPTYRAGSFSPQLNGGQDVQKASVLCRLYTTHVVLRVSLFAVRECGRCASTWMKLSHLPPWSESARCGLGRSLKPRPSHDS